MDLYINYNELEKLFSNFFDCPINKLCLSNNKGDKLLFTDIKRLLSDSSVDFGVDLDDCK